MASAVHRCGIARRLQRLLLPTRSSCSSFHNSRAVQYLNFYLYYTIHSRNWYSLGGSLHAGQNVREAGKSVARSFGVISKDSKVDEEIMANNMIDYAADYRGKFTEQLEINRVLEQGYTHCLRQGPTAAIAAAKLLLTLATFHVDRASIPEACELLHQVANLEGASREIRISAVEALVGIYLRLHAHPAALGMAEKCMQLMRDSTPADKIEELQFRATVIMQFADLANPSCPTVNIAHLQVNPLWMEDRRTTTDGLAAAVLGLAECAHVQGHLPQAREFYEQALSLSETIVQRSEAGSTPGRKGALGFSAGAMTPKDVRVGALAGLGQLALQSGDYKEAELQLGAALKHAEELLDNKRIGAVLCCLANVFGRKGLFSDSAFMLYAEGMYRKCIDLMGTPALDDTDLEKSLDYRDIMVISRARYAFLLSHFQERVSEAEKMWAWAQSAWTGSCPLAELLNRDDLTLPGFSSAAMGPYSGKTLPGLKSGVERIGSYSGRYPVVDIRLGRVL